MIGENSLVKLRSGYDRLAATNAKFTPTHVIFISSPAESCLFSDCRQKSSFTYVAASIAIFRRHIRLGLQLFVTSCSLSCSTVAKPISLTPRILTYSAWLGLPPRARPRADPPWQARCARRGTARRTADIIVIAPLQEPVACRIRNFTLRSCSEAEPFVPFSTDAQSVHRDAGMRSVQPLYKVRETRLACLAATIRTSRALSQKPQLDDGTLRTALSACALASRP
eukprot:6184271-Pleurochrysis_carterae.AAC.6